MERLLRFVRGSRDKIFGQFGHFLATLPTFKNRVWPQEVFVDEYFWVKKGYFGVFLGVFECFLGFVAIYPLFLYFIIRKKF